MFCVVNAAPGVVLSVPFRLRRSKFDFLAQALSSLPSSGTLVGDVVGVEERAVSPMSSSRDQLIKAFETLDVDGSGACVAKQLRTWATKSSPT